MLVARFAEVRQTVAAVAAVANSFVEELESAVAAELKVEARAVEEIDVNG